MRPIALPLLALVLFTGACRPPEKKPQQKPLALATGPWLMKLDIDSTSGHLDLPFRFNLAQSRGGWRMTIHNQDEAIVVDSVTLKRDSVFIRMPFFDSDFRGTIQGPRLITGLWHNRLKGPHYAIPFTATAGEQARFNGHPLTPPPAISGDWEAHFTGGKEDEPAIGIFSVDGNAVKGTFATETGDMRYLAGMANADSLFLSTFNGSAAYLLQAAFRHDSIIGMFHSGHRWKQPWYAVRNPGFKLGNDEALTKLKPDVPVGFTFPSVEGGKRSLSDARYHGKVTVVEVMGTWCPNCLDESRMLNELYGKYHGSGLEVISLAFERRPDTARAMAAIRHFRDKLGLGYNLLYAGRATHGEVSKKLPFLANFMSYPTTLLIGRDGTVRKVFTGIYGPGTGVRYTHFRERMENTIVDLLREAPPA